MEYTPEQKEVIKSLKKFLFHSRDREILLNAPGGTGKTAIISRIFEGIPDVQVVFTAPTHQALSVLLGALGECKYSLMTIHKFLRLTLDEGKLIQKRRREENEDVDFLIVDECSMVGQELLYFINRFLEGHPECKIVYLGDTGQLPPVGEQISGIFKKKIGILTLTKNMRSGSELVMKYRNFQEFPERSGEDWSPERLVQEFLGVPDGATKVILCWSNVECEFINKIVLLKDSRQDSNPLPGDTLVCLKTHLNLAGELTYSGQRVKIERISEDGKVFNRVYYVKLFSHSFAMTVHKSQGSGFDYVFVNENDILRNPVALEKKQCLYTAVSRARREFKLFNLIRSSRSYQIE